MRLLITRKSQTLLGAIVVVFFIFFIFVFFSARRFLFFIFFKGNYITTAKYKSTESGISFEFNNTHKSLHFSYFARARAHSQRHKYNIILVHNVNTRYYFKSKSKYDCYYDFVFNAVCGVGHVQTALRKMIVDSGAKKASNTNTIQ